MNSHWGRSCSWLVLLGIGWGAEWGGGGESVNGSGCGWVGVWGPEK